MNTKFDVGDVVYLPDKNDALQKKSIDQPIQYKGAFEDYIASQQFIQDETLPHDIEKSLNILNYIFKKLVY